MEEVSSAVLPSFSVTSFHEVLPCCGQFFCVDFGGMGVTLDRSGLLLVAMAPVAYSNSQQWGPGGGGAPPLPPRKYLKEGCFHLHFKQLSADFEGVHGPRLHNLPYNTL